MGGSHIHDHEHHDPEHRDHDHDHCGDHAHEHARGHDHSRAHRHGGHHHHHHHVAPGDMGRAFAIGVALNSAFVVAEVVAGLYAGSLALLADAGHNLSDVLALVLAWGAATLARRAPAGRRTYGLRKTTILASLTNAVLLLVAVGAIISESVRRFSEPASVETGVVMLTAGLGVVINTGTALLFFRGSHNDLNVRGAFLHMAADAAVSLVVVISALVIGLTGLNWIDPALSLAIAAFILVSTWGLLTESIDLALDAAPKEIDVGQVRAWLAAQPGVAEVHDLHIWAMSTTETALTAHLVMPGGYPGDEAIDHIVEHLREDFAIHHCTLQVEQGTTNHSSCALHDGHDHDHDHDHDHGHGHAHAGHVH